MKKILTVAAASALLAVFTPAMPTLYAAQYDNSPGINQPENKIDALRQPHGQIFYLAKKVVDVNILEDMKKARYLTVTGQDYGLAKALLDKVITVNDKVSEAYLLRGLCLTDMGKHSEAEKDYKAALMLEPENPTFYYFRGLNYLKWGETRRGWGDNGSARAQFDKALGIEANYIDAIVGVGDSYFAGNDYTKAIEYYDKVLAIFPNHDVVLAKKQDARNAIQKEKEKRDEEERQREIRRRIG